LPAYFLAGTLKVESSRIFLFQERISRTFPTPVDKWALTEAQRALDRGKKKSTLSLPLDKGPMLFYFFASLSFLRSTFCVIDVFASLTFLRH
jgi:hypothetical protein